VAEIAAEKLDLWNRPEFAGRKGSPLSRLVGWGKSLFPGAGQGAPQDEASRFEAGVGFIQGNLSISLVRNSYLVTVSFEDRHPRLAADAANAVAAAYRKFQHDSRYDTTGEAKEFLTKDVARVQAEVAVLEKKLQDYGVEKEILALSDGTRDISEQALADINRRYTEARSRLASARARYDSVQQSPPEALSEVLKSPIIGHLRQRHAELERDHAQMAQRFKPDWPARVQLEEELRLASEQLSAEAENIAIHVRAAARAESETAQAEFEAFRGFQDLQKLEVQRVGRDAIDYASLKIEIETKRNVLADLVTRKTETETSFGLRETGASNVRVVDVAQVPGWPSSPNKRANFLLSLVLGLGLGAFLALLVDHLDNTIKTEQDVVRISGLTVLGHVPLTKTLKVVAEGADRSRKFELDLASHVDPRSHFSETFRNLRTSLLLATPDHPPRHVLVTSCEPADGKSTIALNLAIVLNQLGRKVLLVDADLRRPRLHKTFSIENRFGLSTYLSGNAAIDGIVQKTDVPNLHMIPSGPIPPNPSELLGSPRLDVLLGEFLNANGFDHLILDSPPLLSVADSIVLSSRTDSTILVVRSDSTRRESLSESASRLKQSRANIIGIVLNAVQEESGYYSRYYLYRRRYYNTDGDPATAADPQDEGSARSRKAG